jgi:two-component system, NtrC family, nitrogen regulation response regulator NtrX
VMPGKDGLALLQELKSQKINTPVVMMSGQAHIEMAVRATKLGAVDFLEKPISTDRLLLTIENVLKLQRLESENRSLKQGLGKYEIVWTSEIMRNVMAQVQRVAASESRVCILGETGTGKELVARKLHEQSPRAAGPFVALNCAAVPAELIESELFGHEKGSFTGAAGRHIGKFEQADGGTLFLDEIGDMPVAMQAKLLRVLEEGEIERIGGHKSLAVNVRVIVATHRNLRALVHEGKFRQDLFHRVYVFPLTLPLLRERREDIPVLVEHFARQICAQNNWKQISFDGEAMQLLGEYSWPGNIRELRNIVERLILLAGTDEVTADTVRLALPPAIEAQAGEAGSGSLAERVDSFERETISAELRRHNYHITKAAKALGLERSHFYKKAEQLGIEIQKEREANQKS